MMDAFRTRPIYIGLNAIIPDEWKWTDTTSFDFGNDISGGVYPWNMTQPSHSPACIIIQLDSNYKWHTTACNHTDAIFACNSCDETLTKYSMITDTQTRSNQASLCSSVYGTELMSMHSYRDFDEAAMICGIAPQNIHCYVGLLYDSSAYHWDDGSTFDYASTLGVYPWDATPNYATNDCAHIALNSNKYVLSDTPCTSSQYGLCNLPSETCYSHLWSVISGFGWTFTTKPCTMRNDNRYIGGGSAVITSKQWNNNGNDLVFEYIFTIEQTQTDDASTAGVVWYVNGTCSPYYYLGISIDRDNINAVVFLGQVTDGDISYMDTRPLPFEYELGTFYILRGEISTWNTFTISINDHILFLNADGANLFDSMDTSVGYIGVMNTKSSMVAKSLFVSGDIELGVPPKTHIAQWAIHCPSSTIHATKTDAEEDSKDAGGPSAPLSMTSILGIAAVAVVLCLLSCCVIGTIYKIRRQKKKISTVPPSQDPEEIVNIQMQHRMDAAKQPQGAVVSVNVMEDPDSPPISPVKIGKEANMANEFERALVAAWLENDVGLPQYYKLFIRNGYESMRIIKEIHGKEQLTAIGIGLLGHQTMIMSEIQRYNIQSHINLTNKGRAKDGCKDTGVDGYNYTGSDGYDTGFTMPPLFKKLTFGVDEAAFDIPPQLGVQPGEQPGGVDPMHGVDDHPLPEEGEYESGKVDASMRSSFGDDLFGTYIQ